MLMKLTPEHYWDVRDDDSSHKFASYWFSSSCKDNTFMLCLAHCFRLILICFIVSKELPFILAYKWKNFSQYSPGFFSIWLTRESLNMLIELMFFNLFWPIATSMYHTQNRFGNFGRKLFLFNLNAGQLMRAIYQLMNFVNHRLWQFKNCCISIVIISRKAKLSYFKKMS